MWVDKKKYLQYVIALHKVFVDFSGEHVGIIDHRILYNVYIYVYTYMRLQYTSRNDHGDRQPAREFVSISQRTHTHTQVWSTTHPFKVRRPPHWRRVYFDNNFIHYNVRGAMPIRSDRRSGQRRRQEIARIHPSHLDTHTH